MSGVEANFDGLVGPTHNYAGLSHGNVASQSNEGRISNPREAALQGIAKMRAMKALGLPQGVLAPQERPHIRFLRSLGFTGADRAVWEAAMREEPTLARSAIGATSMWTANAATVSASADTRDGRLHLSVANLSSMLHRQLEADTTTRLLRAIFADPSRFEVHDALTPHPWLSDEGAANHMRLAPAPAAQGVDLFVYGRAAGEAWRDDFPARQSLEACRAVARRHGLDPARTVYMRQSRAAIAAGAFHNDVVAVTGGSCLFHHELAFEEPAELAAAMAQAPQASRIEAPSARVPLKDAVQSYLFNSQLVAPPGANGLALIAPQEVAETPSTRTFVEEMIASGGPITAVHFFDLRESMRNGGGPACLRLRVPLSAADHAAITQGFLLSDDLAASLEAWVKAHYRDRLAPSDLADPALVDESQTALDALTRILPLGSSFYDFQRA